MKDKKFYQLIFAPFLSAAMNGDDARLNMDVMAKRMKEMSPELRADLVAALKIDMKESQIKIRSLPSSLGAMYRRKINAIETLLARVKKLR